MLLRCGRFSPCFPTGIRCSVRCCGRCTVLHRVHTAAAMHSPHPPRFRANPSRFCHRSGMVCTVGMSGVHGAGLVEGIPRG
eukprot:12889155-Prorocentrum_lima.AAC.1